MSNYKVVVHGVTEGRMVDEVATGLSRMSLKPTALFKSLLQNGGFVVKRTSEVQKAVRYKKALEQIGCICVIEAEITPEQAHAENAQTSVTVNVTESYDANENFDGGARDFQYANYPVSARLRAIAGTLRLKEWLTVGAFVSVVFYYGSHILV